MTQWRMVDAVAIGSASNAAFEHHKLVRHDLIVEQLHAARRV
jgi:hypothetical protein